MSDLAWTYKEAQPTTAVTGWHNLRPGMAILLRRGWHRGTAGEALNGCCCYHCARAGVVVRPGELFPILAIETRDPGRPWLEGNAGWDGGGALVIRHDCGRVTALSRAFFGHEQPPVAYLMPGVRPLDVGEHPAAIHWQRRTSRFTLAVDYDRMVANLQAALTYRRHNVPLHVRLQECVRTYLLDPHRTLHEDMRTPAPTTAVYQL